MSYNRKPWGWALAALVAFATVAILLGGCIRIPVTVHAEADDAGMPIPLAVTPVGTTVPAEGGGSEQVPVYPTSSQPPKPPPPATDWLGLILQIGGAAVGVGGLGWAARAVTVAGKARKALRLVAGLADQLADAPDEAAVARAKAQAAAEQEAAGVRDLIQRERGLA